MFSDPFVQGCYSPISESIKHGFDLSKQIPLHNYDSSSSVALGAVGTYDISAACRRYCYAQIRSLLFVIADYKCYCLSSSARLSDISNLQSFRNVQACANFNGFFSNNLQRGFSTINLVPGFESSLPIPAHFCGSIENDGVCKCGSTDNTNPLATLYGFEDFLFLDRSYKQHTGVNLLTYGKVELYNTTRPIVLLEIINFTITLNFCSQPFYLSENKTLCLSHHLPILIKLKFGDGTEYENYIYSFERSGLPLSHYYNKTGEYEVQLEVRISPKHSSGFQKRVIKVNEKVEKFIPLYLNVSRVALGADIEVTSTVLYGTHLTCTFDYGDNTLREKYYYPDSQAFKTLYHSYKRVGTYTVSMTCSNILSKDTITGQAIVQEVSAGLQVPVDTAISNQNYYEHKWNLLQGFNVVCKLFFGDRLVSKSSSNPNPNSIGSGSYYFNNETNEGVALLPAPDNENHGVFTVLVACVNPVTTILPVAITYLTFEEPIKNIRFQHLTTDPYFEENQPIPLSLTIGDGSNWLMRWHWNKVDDKDVDVIEFCNSDDCKSR